MDGVADPAPLSPLSLSLSGVPSSQRERFLLLSLNIEIEEDRQTRRGGGSGGEAGGRSLRATVGPTSLQY